MVPRLLQFVLVLILADTITAFVFNETAIDDYENQIKLYNVETRRQGKKKSESTSSDGPRRGEGGGSRGGGGDDGESLEQSFTGHTSTDTDEKRRVKKDRTPKSTIERKGWRKWHRKCTKCPDDMRKKWRDPSIKWICGAYQRARRSFKSLCMMHYRNCQDGTMFTKIADYRCPNSEGQVRPYGEHFFYDYEVVISADDSKTEGDDNDDEKTKTEESSSWSESRIAKLPPLEEPGKVAKYVRK